MLLNGQKKGSREVLRYSRRSFYFWKPRNIFLLIAFSSILLTSIFVTFTSSSNSFHPTSIPWLTNKASCEHTGRTWSDGSCWDYEHSPLF